MVMPRTFQVRVDTSGCYRVQRQVTHLAAFSMDLQMLDTAAFLDVAHLQQCCFFALQPVVQQHCQDGPIAQSLECGFIRCIEQGLSLMVSQRRRLALVALDLWPFDAVHWVPAGNGVVFQKVIEEAGQRCQFASDGSPGQAS